MYFYGKQSELYSWALEDFGFWIYGTLSVDDLFFRSNLPESFLNLYQD